MSAEDIEYQLNESGMMTPDNEEFIEMLKEKENNSAVPGWSAVLTESEIKAWILEYSKEMEHLLITLRYEGTIVTPYKLHQVSKRVAIAMISRRNATCK